MRCPVCGTQYAFFEKKCTRCDVDLVPDDETEQDRDASSTEHPDTPLVSVFKTDDLGRLPLATMALEDAGIEYFAKSSGKVDNMQWAMSQRPTTRAEVHEIIVAADVADRARELLVDLEQAPSASLPADPSSDSFTAQEPATVLLEDAVAGTSLGAITESQLQEITSRLEEDAPHQYFITGATVDMLQQAGVDADLIALLRNAVGAGGDGLVIRWVVH